MSLSLKEYESRKEALLREILGLFKAKKGCAYQVGKGDGAHSLSMLNQINVLTSQIDDRLEELFVLEKCLP